MPMKDVPEAEEMLAKLFGSVSRARIIDLLVSQVGRAFYQREIMYEAGLSLHPTQRELGNLIDLKIVKKKETKDKVYYKALRLKGRSFPVRCFHYIAPLDSALKGGLPGPVPVKSTRILLSSNPCVRSAGRHKKATRIKTRDRPINSLFESGGERAFSRF